jgi:large subunit ribosomal protein L13
MKTIFLNPKNVEHKWILIDAEGKTLGRLAVRVADILRGKVKPAHSPHMATGDSVVLVNAEKVHVTGRKKTDKLYHRYSGYPGGMTTESFAKVISRKPTFPLEHAIKGMLPKGSLGRRLFLNVKIYAGPSHPHEAQQPVKLDF